LKRYLICTDLDRTLIPNGAQPESPQARARFKRLAAREDVAIAYVSGRHFALIEQAIKEFDLPQPDFAIADVGSTIYQTGEHASIEHEIGHAHPPHLNPLPQAGEEANESLRELHISRVSWQQWDAWDSHISPDWQGLTHDELDALLKGFPALRLQEKEKQNRHKLSYYVPLEADAQALLAEVGTRLKQAGIKANLIWSIDEEAGIGLLDLLPVRANKLHAIQFLMQKKGYSHENTVFAGDSGNDLDVLLSDIHAVLVANADPEVKVRAAAAHKDALYIAQGAYLGMNGNYSAGILEGVAHYLPELDAWMNVQN